MTIRFRIIIYYSSLLIAILSIFGAAVFGMLQWMMLGQIDSDLQEVVRNFRDSQSESTTAMLDVGSDGRSLLIIRTPELDELRTPGVYLQVWQTQGGEQLISASYGIRSYTQPLDPSTLHTETRTYSNVRVRGTHLRVLTQPIVAGGSVIGVIQAATTLNTVDAATDRLLKIMLGGGIIALLVSLMLGDLIARRILIPVEAIARTAQNITAAEDLEQRIPYSGPQDELGRMVRVFNETLDRLERQFQAQKRFVGDVSHELRTPLTSIQGNLDLLRLYGPDARSIQAMESEAQRMSRLVGDLLLLAQADSGQLPMTFQPTDLDHLVLEVYNEAVLLSKGRYHVKLGKMDVVRIEGDADRLKQLLLNLVTNAFKYTKEGGSVEITLQGRPNEAQVSVSDTGIGIPAEDLPHIFDRFYRVDKARSRGAGGTGLGLSIVKWIAEAHQGRVKVESEVEKGTTFTVILPLQQPLPELLETPEKSPNRRLKPSLN